MAKTISERHDPTVYGPIKSRSCTDLICLILFIFFIAGWIFIFIFALEHGDIDRLKTPTDSNGKVCGRDDYKTRKHLFFFDLSKCANAGALATGCPTTQVCVNKCPTENFFIHSYLGQGIETFREKLICIDSVKKEDIKTYEEALAFTQSKDGHEPKCASYYFNGQSIFNRCIPISKDINKHLEHLNNTFNLTNYQNGIANVKLGEHAIAVITDIQNSLVEITLGFLVAILVSLIFVFIMRYIAGLIIWSLLFGLIFILACGTIFSYTQYSCFKNINECGNKTINIVNSTQTISPEIDTQLRKPETWLAILIIMSVLLVIILLIVIFMRKRIILAVALIKEGSKAVSAITSTVIFPIIPFVLQIIVIAFSITVFVQLYSARDTTYKISGNMDECKCVDHAATYKNESYCSIAIFEKNCHSNSNSSAPCESAKCSFQGLDIPRINLYFQLYNVFAFFWVINFISAFGEMVLAGTFSIWYWTFKKEKLPFFTLIEALLRTLRYHLGTLAFGSLIIAICKMIKLFLEYMQHKLKDSKNRVALCLLCCLRCFFSCLERFLKLINKNAYIVCAIHGKSFCASAGHAFSLISNNCLRFVAVDNVTGFIFFLTKLTISFLVGFLAMIYYEEYNKGKITHEFVPIGIIALGAYLIASIFFSVYSMAVDTLLLCFLEDCEINDGSEEKPYFMSKSLMKILGKKNELSKQEYD